MKSTTLQTDNRQKGMALVLAIGFLAILSILGAIVLSVATRDLQGSAEIRPRQEAFSAADRAVEYAMNRDVIVNLGVNGTINLMTAEVIESDGTVVAGVTHKSVIDGSGRGFLVSGTITDIGPRSLPPAMAAIHGSEFGANLYHVNVKTRETLGGTTHVDAAIVRLFKMDDDQIFRTSGGG